VPTGWPTLVAWLERHGALHGLALDVWCAIAEDDAVFRTARGAFDAALRAHAALEEEVLLPAWETLPDPPPNATAAVYRADHDRLRALLDALERADTPLDRAAATATLLDVLDHHDRREASALMPGLDRAWSAEARAAFLRRAAAIDPAPSLLPPLRGRGAPTSDPALAFATDAPLDGLLDAARAPAHPKGPRLLGLVRAAAAEASAAATTRERRSHLRTAYDRWRLLGLLRPAP
jgi:hypothetical protein